MTQEVFWLVVAASAVIVAVAMAAIAWSIMALSREADRTASETRALVRVIQAELPPTVAALQRASDSLERLAAEGGARLATADRLAEEAESTMAAMRDLSSSVHEIVRGPADTVNGVRRSARMVGDGIATGAGRIRRVITGDHGDGGE